MKGRGYLCLYLIVINFFIVSCNKDQLYFSEFPVKPEVCIIVPLTKPKDSCKVSPALSSNKNCNKEMKNNFWTLFPGVVE